MAQFEEGEPVGGWIVDYYKNRSRWQERMEPMLGELYQRLLKPVHRQLRAKLGDGVHPLVIVPSRALALLPLHACWWEENGQRRYLMDEFVIRYAPSLTLFARLWEREQQRQKGLQNRRKQLRGVANPQPTAASPLPFAEYECEAIMRRLGDERCQVLLREQATKAALLELISEADLLHLATHAAYNWSDPLNSPVLLARGETLTLGEVLLLQLLAWLVVLSACETSLKDFRDLTDEALGLAVGFLLAGAPTVWASLWSVNDIATGLLMAKAYEYLEQGMGKAEALRAAQLWLRELTAREACEVLDLAIENQTQPETRMHLRAAKRALEFWQRHSPDLKPFQHPYHWAGFHCVGA